MYHLLLSIVLQAMSMPSDADLMQLSDTVRGSYILFEQEHRSLVSIMFTCCTAQLISHFNKYLAFYEFKVVIIY